MLIVYDFDSGSAPTIRLLRWHTSGACDAGGTATAADPCWVSSGELTSLGFAEAKVNTVSTASDTVAPSNETLGLVEFGEAGIDLTDAGVFTAGTCESFGTVFGVSRTSGNSSNAQMKDIVGPGPFTLSNCGEIVIKKRTVPRGLNQAFSFTSNIGSSSTASCTKSTANSFSLNDNGNTSSDSSGNTQDCTSVGVGSYTVNESASDPSGFAFDHITCTSSGAGTSASTSGRQVSITLAGGGLVTCIYFNKRLTGAIAVTKTGKDKRCTGTPLPSTCQSPSVALLSGATFQIWKETNGTAGLQIPGDTLVTSGSTGTDGTKCFGNLLFGGYYARETVAPNGYKIDSAVSALKTVNASGACPSTGTVVPASFTDTPLSKITISFESKAGSGATLATISCSNPSVATQNLVQGTPKVLDNLVPDTATGYTCTVKIDP